MFTSRKLSARLTVETASVVEAPVWVGAAVDEAMVVDAAFDGLLMAVPDFSMKMCGE